MTRASVGSPRGMESLGALQAQKSKSVAPEVPKQPAPVPGNGHGASDATATPMEGVEEVSAEEAKVAKEFEEFEFEEGEEAEIEKIKARWNCRAKLSWQQRLRRGLARLWKKPSS